MLNTLILQAYEAIEFDAGEQRRSPVIEYVDIILYKICYCVHVIENN